MRTMNDNEYNEAARQAGRARAQKEHDLQQLAKKQRASLFGAPQQERRAPPRTKIVYVQVKQPQRRKVVRRAPQRPEQGFAMGINNMGFGLATSNAVARQRSKKGRRQLYNGFF